MPVLFYKKVNNFFCYLPLVIALITFTVHAKEELNTIDSLKALLKTQQIDTARARTLQDLASRLRHSNTAEALAYGQEALKIVNTMNSPSKKAVVLQILGLIYNARADYPNSIFYTLQALRIHEAINNIEGRGNAMNTLGIIYMNLKKYDIAKSYLIQSMQAFQQGGLQNRLGMTYCNLGNLLYEQGKIHEALSDYNKALEYAYKNKDNNSIIINTMNLAETYGDIGQSDSCRYYYARVLKMDLRKEGDYERILTHIYQGLGKIELRENNLNMATRYLMYAKQLAEQGSMTSRQIEIYKDLVDLYKKEKKFDSAFAYNVLYHTIKDSSVNESTVKQLSEVQKAYEVEKRDKEIQLLNKDKELAENKARTSRNFFIALFSFTIIIILIVARNIFLKQVVRNKILSEEKAVIEMDIVKLINENTEAKYETLKSKINPHFLFNSLTTLSSLVIEGQEGALKYIDNFSDLYRMILETGNAEFITMENELKIVNNYIYLQKMECGNNLNVDIQVPTTMYSYMLPPLALQMAIENAIKHNIITAKNNLNIFIHIEEQGVIIENNLQKKNAKALSTKTGQKNITERYQISSNAQPQFIETKTAYIVKLPLFEGSEKQKLVYNN